MSKPSFEVINYSLRLGKAVERKMISSLLTRLSVIDPIDNYRYIGFGSTYFHDFVLFHKELGIRDLVSIEAEVDLEDRFIFNKPFKCIDLRMGLSYQILPTLNWNKRTILWLDYDSKLSVEHFQDISTFCTNTLSGGVLMITINCQGNSYGQKAEDRQEYLIENLGEDSIPYTFDTGNFTFENIAQSLKTILDTQILTQVREVNTGKSDADKLTYYPVINFKYKDGATMMTVGGIFLNAADKVKFDTAQFEDLYFYRSDQEFFSITVPSITSREVKFINSQLPSGVDEDGNFTDADIVQRIKPMIPAKDVRNYAKIYRFLPSFAESYTS